MKINIHYRLMFKTAFFLVPLAMLLHACSQSTNKKEAEPQTHEAVNDSIKKIASNPDAEFVKEIDVNGDGKMSREEWNEKQAPASSFNMFEKGRGYVTKADYDTNKAPDGIDINKDGKLTLEEFIQFDKKMALGMGAPPPPKNTNQ